MCVCARADTHTSCTHMQSVAASLDVNPEGPGRLSSQKADQWVLSEVKVFQTLSPPHPAVQQHSSYDTHTQDHIY